MFKILNFNIVGGFQKNEYFCGNEDYVDIFGGHHKIGLVFKVQNLDIFGGLLKFQIFHWECLIFLIFLGVNGRCWVQANV